MPKRRPPADRFWERVDQSGGPDACWLWTGRTNSKGYGFFTDGDGRDVRVHRWSYEAAFGPIPDGLTIDHTCHNAAVGCVGNCSHRRCVNPAHLAAATNAENLAAGRSVPAVNAAKTHCPAGHPYDAANTLPRRDHPGRYCRACTNARRRRRRARVRSGS